jgi:hypothetical protein
MGGGVSMSGIPDCVDNFLESSEELHATNSSDDKNYQRIQFMFQRDSTHITTTSIDELIGQVHSIIERCVRILEMPSLRSTIVCFFICT